MSRFIEGEDRNQATLLPEYLDDYIAEDNPVRAVDAFVDELDLKQLGFAGADPASTGRPAYHPAVLLKLYIYAYLNRIASSRRLEREAQRNVELMWLTGRLAPDFKTIADFRHDNGEGIRNVCRLQGYSRRFRGAAGVVRAEELKSAPRLLLGEEQSPRLVDVNNLPCLDAIRPRDVHGQLKLLAPMSTSIARPAPARTVSSTSSPWQRSLVVSRKAPSLSHK